MDYKLNFNKYVTLLLEKASHKLNTLSRIAYYVVFDQKGLIFNSFVISSLSSYPIANIFHGRKLNEIISNDHERILKIVYQDYKLSF